MRRRAMRLLPILAALAVAMGASAETRPANEKETFEPGTGKYIVVLRRAPSDAIDPVTGKVKAKEPDVTKLGGKVLHKKDLTRLVKLPAAAANKLRKEENVAYVQRVWIGEDRASWNDQEGQEEPNDLLRSSHEEGDEQKLTNLTWTTGVYQYDGSGNIKQIGADVYRYDTGGRLIEAVVKGERETYRYDSFGNLLEKVVGGNAHAVAVSLSTNRMSGQAYDAAGNVTTQNGVAAYTYDSVSMMDSNTKGQSTFRMIYGPDDERIGVIQESTLSRWKIRGFDGKVLREYRADDIGDATVWTWMKDYVYGEGRLLGTERMSGFGGRRQFHTDHLGNVRMITDQNRYRISVHEYRPFGAEQTDVTQELNNFYDAENPVGTTGDNAADAMKFTGHERDYRGWLNVNNDDYLDYMHARYYDPRLGRFLSVDPAWESAGLAKPQSWNRYSYVLNNPINYTDPDGRVCSAAVVDCILTGTSVAGPAGAVVGTVVGVGIVYVGRKVDWRAVGEWLASGNTGGGDQMAAETSVQNWAKSEQAKQDSSVPNTNGTLPKPPTGAGSVPPQDRDPQRNFSPKQREAKRDAQGGTCANGCGTAIDATNSRGHHIVRHADGGKTTDENHAEVCVDCHKELHSPPM
jgi:RHS repeat-associated protein